MTEPSPTPDEVAKVLRSFVKDGQLTTMPRPGRKRAIVLAHIVQEFEPGERYDEIHVNRILRGYWADVAALRRYLIEGDLLERDHGTYWRTGGPVDVG